MGSQSHILNFEASNHVYIKYRGTSPNTSFFSSITSIIRHVVPNGIRHFHHNRKQKKNKNKNKSVEFAVVYLQG